MANLTPELEKWRVKILKAAEGYGLDIFETIFELITYDQINQFAAYGGFPVRYPHWRFGMEYEQLSKGYEYGLSKIYEMVINTDPCYAYLMEGNRLIDQKLVMAHVYGHCDFFKNNQWFAPTNRKMMDVMANHATRVRRHIERQGQDVVERFLDTCLSIEHLIDPHSMFVARDESRSAAAVDRSAFDDPNPVMFFEHKAMYDAEMEVPDEAYAIPFGEANVSREGDDVRGHRLLPSARVAPAPRR